MDWKFKYYDVENGVDWNGIERDFEWFRDMLDVPQDEIWHAEGNVQIHTKMVVEALINLDEFKKLSDYFKHVLVVSALMHDIEKRSTTTTEKRDGRICVVAPRHAQKGEKTARTILYKELNVPFKTREQICALVRYHGIPLWANDKEGYNKTLAALSLRISPNLVGMLAEADVMGRNCPDKDDLLFKIEIFYETCTILGCYDVEAPFQSNLGRYYYLNRGGYIKYDPYDESKFTVHMMVGIAGSGKDTFIKNNLSELPIISLDDIRREFKILPTDKKGNGTIIQEGKERCKQLMRKHKDFVFNATNLTRDMRSKWISLFQEYGGKVIVHYIEVPYQDLIKQNHNRKYKVPESVIDKMIEKLEVPFFEEAQEIVFEIK